MKQNQNYRKSTRQNRTTTVGRYYRNHPAQRWSSSPSALRGAAVHVVRSHNPRTQAVGVTIAVAAAAYSLAKLGQACLNIINKR